MKTKAKTNESYGTLITHAFPLQLIGNTVEMYCKFMQKKEEAQKKKYKNKMVKLPKNTGKVPKVGEMPEFGEVPKAREMSGVGADPGTSEGHSAGQKKA